MPKDSIPPLSNFPGAQGWEEMRLYRNEKLIPSPLTDGLGRSPYGDRPRLEYKCYNIFNAKLVF